MNTEIRNHDATNYLTRVESGYIVADMLRLADLDKALRQQIAADLKQLKANYTEQNKLRSAVSRFRDLESEAKTREERLERAVSLTGADEWKDLRKEMLAGFDVSGEIAIPMVQDLPLWRAMQAIVEQVTEIQVVALQHALEHFGRSTSRQAIESALASHKETFETKTRGREKFVSLKR